MTSRGLVGRAGAGRRRALGASIAAVSAATLAVAGCSSSGNSGSGGSSGSIHLKIASIMSYTGDLSSFGAPLEAAVKLAVADINSAAKAAGLNDSISLVDTQDDQSATAPAVEAATKEVTVDGAKVLIGTLGSTSTIAVAQSVAIPQGAMLVSPVASSPSISALKDNNLVFQMYPNDDFQARELLQYIGDTLGKSATLNVGYRNDDYGNGISKIFIDGWKKLGGSVGQAVSWNPTATNFNDVAQKLAGGDPAGWVIFDFPNTFQQVGPALVRTGKWDPTKSFVSAEFRDPSALGKIGAQATNGLRGVAPAAGATPLQAAFSDHFKKSEPSQAPTGYEDFAYDAVVSSFFAALKAKSTDSSKIAAQMQAVTNGSKRYDFQHLTDAFKALAAGQTAVYQGVSGSLDLDAQGAPTASRYDVWKYAAGKLTTLETKSIG